MPHLIVFSHLRWEFVFQRPQHLLSRLARHYAVVFVEEPVHANGPARLERSHPCPGVEVLRPHTAVDAPRVPRRPAVGAATADRRLSRRPTHRRLPGLVLHADGAAPADRPRAASARLRLHGRARRVQERAAADAPARNRAAEERRPRPHRRPSPLRGQARRQPERRSACRAPSMPTTTPRREPPATCGHGARRGAASRSPARVSASSASSTSASTSISSRALADADPAWQIVMVGPVVKIDPAALPRRAQPALARPAALCASCRSWLPAGTSA